MVYINKALCACFCWHSMGVLQVAWLHPKCCDCGAEKNGIKLQHESNKNTSDFAKLTNKWFFWDVLFDKLWLKGKLLWYALIKRKNRCHMRFFVPFEAILNATHQAPKIFTSWIFAHFFGSRVWTWMKWFPGDRSSYEPTSWWWTKHERSL